MRADAEARKVNGIRLKPIKHKKPYGAAARSVVESRWSPSLTLSSKFYEDKNDSKTDSKAKVKPIIQVHGVPVLLSEFEKLASGNYTVRTAQQLQQWPSRQCCRWTLSVAALMGRRDSRSGAPRRRGCPFSIGFGARAVAIHS